MTFSSVTAAARLSATIIPGDPRSSGTYQIGATAQRHSISEANQIFSIKCSAVVDTAALDLTTGILTLSAGGSQAGGDGKDPDGQTVDLDTIYGIHILNTGEDILPITVDAWTGSDAIIGDCSIPSGGELLIVNADGSAITAADITFGLIGTYSYEAVIVGKIQP